MRIYKRMACILSFGILWIGLITFSTGKPRIVSAVNTDIMDNDSDNDNSFEGDRLQSLVGSALPNQSASASASGSVQAEDKPEATPTPVEKEEAPLIVEGDAEIHKLVQSYLNALLSCDIEDFRGIVSDVSYIHLEDIQQRTSTILSYSDLVCYEKKVGGMIDYVVCYTYNMNIVNVEVPAPCVDLLYIRYNEQGHPIIFFGAIDDETSEALHDVIQSDDIQNLIKKTQKQMNDSINSDDALRDFMERVFDKAAG